MFVPQLLEQLLPPRQKEDIPTGENVEEVMLSDYEPQTRGHGGGGGRGLQAGAAGGAHPYRRSRRVP